MASGKITDVHMTTNGIVAMLQTTGERIATLLNTLADDSGLSNDECTKILFNALDHGFRQKYAKGPKSLLEVMCDGSDTILNVKKEGSEKTDDEKLIVLIANDISPTDAMALVPSVTSSVYQHLTPAIGPNAAKDFITTASEVAAQSVDTMFALGMEETA